MNDTYAPEAQQGEALSVFITLFQDTSAQELTDHTIDWEALTRRIRNPSTYPAKNRCPLLKLARFGSLRTEKNTLRHDANVLEIFGIEGDYDDEQVPMAEAAVMLHEAGIEAMLYASPSHHPDRPRWRVLAPLSRSHSPQDRRRLTGQLNGALGGLLTPESFALSQTYYVGRVEGAPYEVQQVRGRCIDLIDGLPEIYPPASAGSGQRDSTTDRELLDAFVTGEGRRTAGMRLAARYIGRGMHPDDALAALLALLGERPSHNSRHIVELQHELRRAVESAAQKFSDPRKSEALSKSAEEWPEPAPLPSGLTPVPAFDLDLLPDPLRSWVSDIAERTQCPPEFPAVGALVALGSVLGRKLAIRPKQQDDWDEFANLWGVVIGPPGVLKSPALNEALRPLRQLEAKAYEQHDQALAEWKARHASARIRLDAARSNAKKAAMKGKEFDQNALVTEDDEEEPQPRRYVVNDCTPEALGVVLAKNANGVLAYRDELHGLLASMDREGMEGARQFYLSAYSGKEPYTFDRITRGRTRIDACCLSLLGSTQPAVISRYIRDAVRDGGGDGLLSRFSLLVWPDLPNKWRDVDRLPDTEHRQQVDALFARVDELFPAWIGAAGEPGKRPFARFSDNARGLFVEWRGDLEARLRDPGSTEHPAFIAHLAKYRKLVPALALLFHVTENGAGEISECCLMRALAWADLLEAHARRAYSAVAQANADGARALIAKLRSGRLTAPFVLRDVYRNDWANLSEPEHARRAAEMLTEFDYLRAEEVKTTGRPRVQYHVNPRALA